MPLPETVERRTAELGRELLRRAAEYRPGVAERVEDWLLTRAVADDNFRGRLLRYMDVLASLDYDTGGVEAKRLAQEYFGENFPGLPRSLRWLLRVARNERLPAPVVGQTANRAAEVFARRFITAPGPETIARTLTYLGDHARFPAFDLLGEAVLSDAEAEAFIARYLDLIARLAEDPAAGAETPNGSSMLQLSIKLSSLTAHFSPVDPEGTIHRVQPAFEAICHAAERAGVGITVDMEQHAFRDLTWTLFRRVLGPGTSLASWPHAGIVVQTYLRDALGHTDDVIAFARERGTPLVVRLVKGAYWDYETIIATQNRWPPPVHTTKSATDATFEAAAERLIQAHPQIRLAIGSHNARSHAVAEALAEHAGLPLNSVEHQTLFRTYEGMSRALATLGWTARDYVPVGELLPGMAYLVRRVLENSSQSGFLLQSRSGVNIEELLQPPEDTNEPTNVAPDGASFTRAPAARWFDAAFSAAFNTALDAVRAMPTRTLTLEAGGRPLAPEETVAIHSPSHPDLPAIALVQLASVEATERAIAVAHEAQPAWAATPVAERAHILRAAADRLHAAEHELAAIVVHEGGRDRADAFAEVEEAVDFLRYYATEAERLFAAHGDRIAPRGVVGVIPPWNFSLAIPCGMTAAALACGNAAVLKPAGQTPLIADRLVQLLHEAGVPRDALICLPGRGSTAGATLANSSEVAMIAFTGSRAVGTELHRVVSTVQPANGGHKALVAELGGKNPVLVFADADLDEAVDGILRSAFTHANQKCSAASRILIEEPIFERFRDRLIEAARSLQVGPADAPETRVNPVVDEAAHRRLLDAARTARQECMVLLDLFDVGETRGAPHEHGPLIVQLPASRALEAKTATEELFGPILVLTPFEHEAEAVGIANGTAYGLTAGLFTRSPATIERVSSALEAGNVYVNRTTTGARPGVEPFGGLRMSGTGPKAGGSDYLWAFTRRTDATEDDWHVAPDAPASPASSTLTDSSAGVADRWDAPITERRRIIELATASIRTRDSSTEQAIKLVTARADEIARPTPTHQIPGQHTALRYDIPRGLALVRARGSDAPAWLTATLLAGNACLVGDSPELLPVIRALHESGLPQSALRYVDGGVEAMLALAQNPRVALAVTDVAGSVTDALHAALGPTDRRQWFLKTLIGPLDGPQPGEAGFARRFAWPKVIAVHTLRHGADLSLEGFEDAAAR